MCPVARAFSPLFYVNVNVDVNVDVDVHVNVHDHDYVHVHDYVKERGLKALTAPNLHSLLHDSGAPKALPFIHSRSRLVVGNL